MKRTKKIIIIAIVLVVSLLAVVSSRYIGKGLFKYFTKTEENPNKLITTDIKEFGYESVSTKIIYEQLTEEEKDLYDLISKKVTMISNTPNTDGFYKIDTRHGGDGNEQKADARDYPIKHGKRVRKIFQRRYHAHGTAHGTVGIVNGNGNRHNKLVGALTSALPRRSLTASCIDNLGRRRKLTHRKAG